MKKEQINRLRTEILRKRYLMKNEKGEVVETEEQMYHRVANTIAAVESQYGETNE